MQLSVTFSKFKVRQYLIDTVDILFNKSVTNMSLTRIISEDLSQQNETLWSWESAHNLEALPITCDHTLWPVQTSFH